MTETRHPAKYTDSVMAEIADIVAALQPASILDPFAGVGGIFRLAEEYGYEGVIVGVEIEPEWAAQHPSLWVGDALDLDYEDEAFEAVITSPTYGNRMADHHNAKDASRRITYRHTLGRPLHEHNTGQLQWGDSYRDFHRQAWAEAARVTTADGYFVLNCKDHIRAGERQRVTDWHISALEDCGFTLLEHRKVAVPSMRWGANGTVRVDAEDVVVMRKGGAGA